MKSLNKTIAAALVLGAMSVGTASAMTPHNDALSGVPGVSAAELNVSVNDGVATLFGTVDNQAEAALAKKHLSKLAGIDKVIDLTAVN